MARRIGFGEAKERTTEAVRRSRRRLDAQRPGPEAAPRRETARPAAGAAEAGPWGASPAGAPEAEMEAERPEPSRRGGIGKLIVLAFLWFILINWTLAAYGGLAEAIWAVQAALNGQMDPAAALLPLVAPLLVGFIATRAILGRRKG